MRSQRRKRQWAVAFLVVLAVLFAPATDDETVGPLRAAEDTVGARILAPTVREGILATDRKFSGRHVQSPDQRLRPESIALTPPSGVALLLFLGAFTWFARRDSRVAPGLMTLQARIPRAPPALQTA